MPESLPARRIVVGVDGTAAADTAVLWAVREARLRSATVHLVRACHHDARVHAPYAPAVSAQDQVKETVALAELRATVELARRCLPSARLLAEVAHELPARALLDRAVGAEMLVLGTNRPPDCTVANPPGPVGPVTRVCLTKAPCPVVVVTSGDTGALEENLTGARAGAATRSGTL